MVQNRNARRKNEATFLEQVLQCLETLRQEVATIKNLLEPDMSLPPVPPPMLDTYNRSFLLQQNTMTQMKGWYGVHLPKCLPIVVAKQDAKSDGYHSEVDEITTFLDKEGHFDMSCAIKQDIVATQSCEKDTAHADMIWSAQEAAYKRRWKENRAIRTIQRSIKAWIGIRHVAPSRRGFTSAKACGPHPGRRPEDEDMQEEKTQISAEQVARQLERCDIVVDEYLNGYFEALDAQRISLDTFGSNDMDASALRATHVASHSLQHTTTGDHQGLFSRAGKFVTDAFFGDASSSITSKRFPGFMQKRIPTESKASNIFDEEALREAIRICMESVKMSSRVTRSDAAPFLVRMAESLSVRIEREDFTRITETFDISLDPWRDKSVEEIADAIREDTIRLLIGCRQ